MKTADYFKPRLVGMPVGEAIMDQWLAGDDMLDLCEDFNLCLTEAEDIVRYGVNYCYRLRRRRQPGPHGEFKAKP